MSTLDDISIATDGYVCGGGPNDIAIAHLGYVCPVEVVVIPVRRGGSSAGMPVTEYPPRTIRLPDISDIDNLKEQIMAEDEEIVQVIIAAIRILDADT